MNKRALIVEPDLSDRQSLALFLRHRGWQVDELPNLEVLAAHRVSEPITLVACAFGPDWGDQGRALFRRIRAALGGAPYILALGGYRQANLAVAAFREGACGYLAKPIQEIELLKQVTKVEAEQAQSQGEEFRPPDGLRRHPLSQAHPLEIIGSAPGLVGLIKQVLDAVAAESALAPGGMEELPNYFLSGETGTGKELLARFIHCQSRSRQAPFVAVNCASLTGDLAESELFGHEAGAFTGAGKARPGLWEQAEGGTLLLDEITEAPASLWPKLLRVLQDGEVRRVGGARWRKMRVQVIATTNREVGPEISAGRFRRDLYQRFLYHFHMPPLRERGEDIMVLAGHFAHDYARREVQFSAQAEALLRHYHWPGNVRELKHLIKSALAQRLDGRVTALALQQCLSHAGSQPAQNQLSGTLAQMAKTAPLAEQVRRFKRRVVYDTLRHCQGNISRTARMLGLSRPAVYHLINLSLAETSSRQD